MSFLRQKYLFSSFVLPLMGICFFPISVFSATFDNVFPSLSAQLGTELSSVKDTKSIVDSYCKALKKSSDFVENNFVYSPQSSSFVRLLCHNVGISLSHIPDGYFKRTTFLDLGIVDYDVDSKIDWCRTLTSNCNLSKHIPNLFNDIIADYVNMKQPNLYGLSTNFDTESDLEKIANMFSSEYFKVDVCATTDHSYPLTCRKLQSYIKNSRNLLSDVYIFDTDNILSGASKILSGASQDVCNTGDSQYDLFLCGLYADSSSLVPFVNLVYNEMFYYRLFVGYYLTALQKHPGILTTSRYYNDFTRIQKNFSSEYVRSKSALSLTFRMMRNMYVAFPFHIGMLMYQEDLDGLAKHLSAIAPPIYTLYDKLRNVQAPH